jgi:hypothetical protein
MRIDKFVKRHSRWLMGFLVVVMGGTLVITFSPGDITAREGETVVGTFAILRVDGSREEVRVTEREFHPYKSAGRALTLLRAMLYEISPDLYAGKLWFDREDYSRQIGLLRRIIQNGEIWPTSPQEEWLKQFNELFIQSYDSGDLYEKVAWETLILDRVAGEQVPRVSEVEVRRLINELIDRGEIRDLPAEEGARQRIWAQAMFRLEPKQLAFAVEALVRAARFLSLNTIDIQPSYAEVTAHRLDQNRQARFRYAVVSARDSRLLRTLRPIRIEEIYKFYKQNRKSFQSPPVARLLTVSATFDEIVKRIPEPPEAELKAVFEQDPKAYQSEGQPIPKFAEVRDKVLESVRKRRARDVANEISWLLWNDARSGVAAFRERSQKDPDGQEVLRIIEAKAREIRTLRGYEFRIRLTDLFTEKQADNVKQDEGLGAKSAIERFAFDPDRRPGDLSGLVEETETGFHFYAIYRTLPPKELPLTRRFEEMIRIRLEQDELVRVAEHEAKAAAGTVEKFGIHEAERRHRLQFMLSGYFPPYVEGAGGFGVDTGISDQQISTAIYALSGRLKGVGSADVERILDRQPKAQLRGFLVGQLDDIYRPPPQEIAREIQRERERKTVFLRNREKEKIRTAILNEAGPLRPHAEDSEKEPQGS